MKSEHLLVVLLGSLIMFGCEEDEIQGQQQQTIIEEL